MGSLSLLQRIFPTQGWNPGLPHCRWILYQLSHKGSQRIPNWVAYPFSGRSSCPRNQTGVSCIAGRFFTNWTIREFLKWRGRGSVIFNIPPTIQIYNFWKFLWNNPVAIDKKQALIYSKFMLSAFSFLFKVTGHRLLWDWDKIVFPSPQKKCK